MADDNLLNPIAAPENATIGDENLTPIEHDVVTVDETVPAQTTGPAAVEVDTVRVTETHLALDEVITDPHSPLAVQIPDAGRGPLTLPIHQLAAVGKPEDQFREAAAEDAKSSKSKK